MHFILLLTAAGALLVAGCSSKTAETPAASGAAETPTVGGAPPSFATRPAPPASESEPAPSVAAEPAQPPPKRTAAANSLHAAVQAASTARGTAEEPPAPTDEPAAVAEDVREEDLPREGDDIRIPPRLLGKLIPGINLEGVEREDPISATALLEAQGIVFTNYQQLVELGVTNYQVIRAEDQARNLLEAARKAAP